MDITKDKELVSAYKEEADELLGIMREAVAGLQLGRDKRVFYRLFRCAHTLKEISGCMGLWDIEKIAGELLKTIGLVKEGKKKLDSRLIEKIKQLIEIVASRQSLVARKKPATSDQRLDTSD